MQETSFFNLLCGAGPLERKAIKARGRGRSPTPRMPRADTD